RRPFARRVARAGHDEAMPREAARRLDQQALEHRLPVLAVRAEVSEVANRWSAQGSVGDLVHRAVERERTADTEALLEDAERRAPREREIRIELRQELPRDVGGLAPLELAERDGGIDVVEQLRAARGVERPAHHLGA